MHPNAVMLATLLLGNLMLPFIWAQNGKKADVSCCAKTEGESHPTCVKDSRVKNVLREDFSLNATVVSATSAARPEFEVFHIWLNYLTSCFA